VRISEEPGVDIVVRMSSKPSSSKADALVPYRKPSKFERKVVVVDESLREEEEEVEGIRPLWGPTTTTAHGGKDVRITRYKRVDYEPPPPRGGIITSSYVQQTMQGLNNKFKENVHALVNNKLERKVTSDLQVDNKMEKDTGWREFLSLPEGFEPLTFIISLNVFQLNRSH
jgi:hypothetical protein